ncbi:RcnB family protein [Azotobacter chroococcum]|uniref:Nickel/cobalt transporter regulator n=1 Tax=Azotobacter chroococcum TaxID=353 RepID=A0A4R1PGL6_9GAMM|nr:RcnB family protein [Azotobacter chroococcum]TCL22664.1 nickel/cobalt transporter regulator [Azotobacter chroococcum]
MQSTRLLAGLGLALCLGCALVPAASAHGHEPDDRRHRDSHAQQRPPADFGPLRQSIHAHRHDIGRGPAVPAHVRIVKGKPLPPGWGSRLSARQLHHLPQYRGYEWRRAGSSLLLVDSRSGVVHEALLGVLD